MKKFLTILLLTAGIFSCKSKSSDSEKTTDTISAHYQEHEESAATLHLNNGAKWKVDSITMINVNQLRDIIAATQQNESKDFTIIAGQLLNSLNKLISECKMTGADHEALHKWLEPLLEQVKKLKEATSATGPALMKEISDHLNLFGNYFEQ